MPRQPRPWRRLDVSGSPWYARVKGKKVWLAPGTASKTEAQANLTQILASTPEQRRHPAGLSVRDVLNLFLADTETAVERGELAAVTLEGYSRYLLPARAALGRYPVGSLKPTHVASWLDSRPRWNATSRYNAITALKRAMNWARRAGHIPTSPLADMPRPATARREKVMAPGQVEQLVAAIPEGDPFRLLVEALRETGCRPGEACGLVADRIDLQAGTWVVSNKTRHATGERTRVVYLSERALVISRQLALRYPTGPVFRNTRGRAWTRNAIVLRMRRLGARLGMGPEAVVYSLRHAWATDALVAGVAPATVAELMGHKSLTMVMRVYSRLKERTDHLREAARKVRPGGKD